MKLFVFQTHYSFVLDWYVSRAGHGHDARRRKGNVIIVSVIIRQHVCMCGNNCWKHGNKLSEFGNYKKVVEMPRGIWQEYVNLFPPNSRLIPCLNARVMLTLLSKIFSAGGVLFFGVKSTYLYIIYYISEKLILWW